MSGGPACKCGEEQVPLRYPPGTPEFARLWRVAHRNCNYSKFNGSRWTWSAYSAVTCLRCGCWWRTTAKYVQDLDDIADSERNLSSGMKGHTAAMQRYGRPVHPHHDPSVEA